MNPNLSMHPHFECMQIITMIERAIEFDITLKPNDPTQYIIIAKKRQCRYSNHEVQSDGLVLTCEHAQWCYFVLTTSIIIIVSMGRRCSSALFTAYTA